MARIPKTKLQDIAEATGVSKMTVSRVLRGGTGFSEETKSKVAAAAARLNYVPDRLAAAFGPYGVSTLVGVCVPRFTSSLFGRVTESIHDNLARLGYQTMIGSHGQMPEDEEKWLQSLASWRPAGVMLAGTRHTSGTRNLLRDLAIPVVEFWELTTKPLDICVGFSHRDCGYEMGRLMVARGRSRIGYVGASAQTEMFGLSRKIGFEMALQDAGIDLAASEILLEQPSFYAGYIATETIMARAPQIDALYYRDDEMAIGGMAYLTRKGVSVPDDIGIAGWGGMEATSILPLRLTTTEVPASRLGKRAAEAAVRRLKGEAVEDVEMLATRLIPGATV